MNTYEWVCGGCETKNVMFVEPEDGKQVTLQCKKCGAPWRQDEEETTDEFEVEKIVASLRVSESICSTSTPSIIDSSTYVGDQFDRYDDMYRRQNAKR